MLRAITTVHWTIVTSTLTPSTSEDTQITGSGHGVASDSGDSAMTPPISTTNSTGRRGAKRSDSSPPAIRPTDSAPVMMPQAAAPPRCARATTGPSTWKQPYQAIRITPNCSTVTHSQVCERNSDQPARRSRSMLECSARPKAGRLTRSISGIVANMPAPQASSAQPGPTAATTKPATTAPPIWPPFMASRLTALACCSCAAGTTRGSRACEAG